MMERFFGAILLAAVVLIVGGGVPSTAAKRSRVVQTSQGLVRGIELEPNFKGLVR